MRIILPRMFFIFLIFSLAFMLAGCEEEAPSISFVDPPLGNLGEVISIHGAHFGPEYNEFSYVTIAGSPPTASSYVSWEDNLIKVKVPEFSSAGLVYIHRGNKKSNPVLFANRAAIPEPIHGEEAEGIPRISSVEPASGTVGSLVTIYGSNFGPSRETVGKNTKNGNASLSPGVYFNWEGELPPGAPAETRPENPAGAAANTVEVSASDFGYEFWSEREIRVRVPDGAVSGNLEVATSKELTRPAFFEVTGMPGTKTFGDKRTYTLSYTVDITVEQAELPNNLFLWIPKPVSSSSQRNVSLLSRSMEPFVENYRGTSLYQLPDLLPGEGREITISYVTDVYAVQSDIRPQNIKQEMNSAIQTVYTMPSALLPSGDSNIAEQAAAIVARERNPYLKAQRIYEWIISEIDFSGAVSGGGGAPEAGSLEAGALRALEEMQADNYRASLLFCSLARAAGVPAVPVAGILIDRNRNVTKHYWAEFWIDSYGWVPLDPALGAGAAPTNFNLREDHAAYYFGNMDNSRVAFSRDQLTLSQMDPRGRVTVKRRDIALQNLWEEATGGLESYSSLWSDISIIGMYVQ